MDSRFSQSGFVTGSCLFVMEARKPPFFYSCFFCGGKFRLFVCRFIKPLLIQLFAGLRPSTTRPILTQTRTCRGGAPPSCLRKTVRSLKSPTGAFIASQTLIFRRKQIIRTHLLSETSSDYFCLVRVARIELTASWTPLCFSRKHNVQSDTA